jgi:hypothetical protein
MNNNYIKNFVNNMKHKMSHKQSLEQHAVNLKNGIDKLKDSTEKHSIANVGHVYNIQMALQAFNKENGVYAKYGLHEPSSLHAYGISNSHIYEGTKIIEESYTSYMPAKKEPCKTDTQ